MAEEETVMSIPDLDADALGGEEEEIEDTLNDIDLQGQEDGTILPLDQMIDEELEENGATAEGKQVSHLEDGEKSVVEGDKAQQDPEEEDTEHPDQGENEGDKSTASADGAEEGGVDGGDEEMKETAEQEATKDEATKDEDEEDDEEDEEEEEEEGSGPSMRAPSDPNVMPQVNVQILAKRKWQVKVYPLRPADFTSGGISRVFKNAKESLLYLISAGKYSGGKGEMYISSVRQTVQVVQGLMKRDSYFPEINIEIVKKNDEGVVEEKAYMRFDSKMVRMLFSPPDTHFGWGVHGRKRERLIGSVFVKNLPPSTSKDMLLVMFPFAQEINYNPEKFKECTARLVLKSRASVIPCLKAFAKVELGGQVLELHPLEKKRSNTRDDKSKSTDSRRRSRSTSVKSDDELSKKDEEDSKKEKPKKEEDEDGEEESKDKEKETPKKSEGSKAKTQSSEQKERRKKAAGFGARPAATRKPLSKKAEEGGDRPSRDRKDSDRPSRKGSLRNDSRGGRGFRGGSRSEGFRNRADGGRRGGFGSRGRSGFGGMRGSNDGRFSSASVKADVMNAEATKDMLVLQNQLSMAIKSQLAVLNQTKMAVEQAKIGASGLGLGVAGSSGMLGSSGLSQMSDVDRGYSPRGPSRDRRDMAQSGGGGGYGQKRKAQQAGMRQGDRGYGKRPFKGKQGQGQSHARSGGRGGSRASDYDSYAQREEEEYRRDLYARTEELRAADAAAYSSFNSSSYGNSASGGYGDSYGYGGYY